MAHQHNNSSDERPRTVERRCDLAVVGGSAAGLAGALQVARQRRSVIVVDAGEPRNASATHMHSYLGYDGRPPQDLTTIGREEVRRYGSEVLDGRVEDVERLEDGHFRLALVGGHSVIARRVLAATGIVDVLPDVEGLAEHWGGDVIHCPFCHGYEVRDQGIVQLVSGPTGLHVTPLLHHLTPHLTMVVQESEGLDDAELEVFRAAGVDVRLEPASRVLSDPDGRLKTVELIDGTALEAEAVLIGTRFRPRIEPFIRLGLKAVPHASGLGDVVAVDPQGGTSVAGLYAAGNLTEPGLQVLPAAAEGSRIGAMIAFDLAQEDLKLASRPSANQADWDARYGAEPLWSGRPNGTLVAEALRLNPGRVLDVGAGEGGDAMWFAENGWIVTASDVSPRALGRIIEEADRRGLSVQALHADANASAPFPEGAFDLVSAQYASIPRTPDDRAVANLLGAVGPGGTLIVVSHDLEPMRQPLDTTLQSRAFDPDAYVRVEDIAATLVNDENWDIELHELRSRPTGATSTHHVDDIVLRARRRT